MSGQDPHRDLLLGIVLLYLVREARRFQRLAEASSGDLAHAARVFALVQRRERRELRELRELRR